MKGAAPWETWIVTIRVPRRHMFRLESLLQGESGMGVARFGDRSGRCELWTTRAQCASLLQWIEEMEQGMQVCVMEVGPWKKK